MIKISIQKIKESYAIFTATDKIVADYILANKRDVIDMSASDLAFYTNTSSAAVIRFSKKLEYDGFSELKIALAKDSSNWDTKPVDYVFLNPENNEEIAQALYHNNQIALERTLSLIDYVNLDEIAAALKDSRKLYIFGIGGSALVAEDFYQKLVRVNMDATHHCDTHMLSTTLTFADHRDAIVLFSYGGKTPEILKLAKQAKSQGVKVIAITQVGISPLSKVADYTINISKEEEDIRLGFISGRISMLTISDLLFLIIVNFNKETVKKNVIKTKRAIDALEGEES